MSDPDVAVTAARGRVLAVAELDAGDVQLEAPVDADPDTLRYVLREALQLGAAELGASPADGADGGDAGGAP